ncbi:MAG: right-handed parallel beta-helix repeat-containing protein [Anaerolineae bacterium]|nr:right-handed parallel beta-helix repeat-containing protein [Anaerolineae bacterium]
MKKFYPMIVAVSLPLMALVVVFGILAAGPAQAAPPVRPLYAPGDCTVTSTLDSGPGSLRQCMLGLQAGATITFSNSVFPLGTPATITLTSGFLPFITTDTVTIDGSNAGVIIDGSSLGVGDGLVITGTNNAVIRGLQIQDFPGNGIHLTNASTSTIGGINSSPDTGCAGDCNLIIGNQDDGVDLDGSATTGNTVSGNHILNNGDNGGSGVSIDDGATNNTIGGTTSSERNLISGNKEYGVRVDGSSTMSNTIKANYIGTNINGLAAIGNAMSGVLISEGARYNIIGGNTPGERNLISGNVDGVIIRDLDTMSNTVSGNYIGTNITGTSIVSNTNLGIIIDWAGHNLIGGNTPAERNLVSGNAYGGIIISVGAHNNIVKGNYIGTDASGTIDLGNTSYGILFRYGAHDNLAENNLIAYTKYRVDQRPGPGIFVMENGSINNTLRQNRIYHNDDNGILLRDGGNQELFPPILTNVSTNTVSGQAPPNSTVEIFSDAEDEGQYYHGSTSANASGNFTFTQASAFTGTNVTATATDNTGNTSEFSSAYEPLVDVQVIAILQPKKAGKQGQSVIPTVKIGNAGTTAETGINVSVQAGGTALSADYGPHNQSTDLPPLGYATLSFPSLTPANVGSYHFTTTVTLTGDQDTSNDVQTQTVAVSSDVIDLWARDNDSDNGDVPTTSFWQSPDIWVRNADDGGLEHQNPLSGTTNYVYMIVRNRGSAASHTGDTIKVYWHEPSLGIKCDDWALIGTATTNSIAPTTGTQLLKFSWIPTRTGHTCLHGEINSADDPVVHQCDIPWDNNLSQRNVDIIPGGAGAQAVGAIVFEVTNIKSAPKPVDLIVDVSNVPDANAVRLDLDSELAGRWASVNGYAKSSGIAWTGGSVITITNASSGTIAGIPMYGSETQTVTLWVNAPSVDTTTVTIYEAIDGGPGVALVDAIVGGNTYVFSSEKMSIYLPIILKNK